MMVFRRNKIERELKDLCRILNIEKRVLTKSFKHYLTLKMKYLGLSDYRQVHIELSCQDMCHSVCINAEVQFKHEKLILAIYDIIKGMTICFRNTKISVFYGIVYFYHKELGNTKSLEALISFGQVAKTTMEKIYGKIKMHRQVILHELLSHNSLAKFLKHNESKPNVTYTS